MISKRSYVASKADILGHVVSESEPEPANCGGETWNHAVHCLFHPDTGSLDSISFLSSCTSSCFLVHIISSADSRSISLAVGSHLSLFKLNYLSTRDTASDEDSGPSHRHD